jgi:type IV secretory pathway TraG/TraD family ATPase VirD4
MLAKTGAASLINSSSNDDRTFQSMVVTLSTYCSKLQYCIAETKPFSFKACLGSQKNCLFVASQENLEALKPLLTLWFELIIRRILAGSETQGTDPNYVILLDELASLNVIPSLPLLATRGRKYGATLLIGLQDVDQLKKIYVNDSGSLCANLSTKFFFRQGSQENAVWVANIIGHTEDME